MNIRTLTLTFALLLAPCTLAQQDTDFFSTPEGQRLAASRLAKCCQEEPSLVLVYQALSPALQEELLNDTHKPTSAELQAGYHSIGDLFLNTLWVNPSRPSRVLCSPDDKHIVQVYDNESGAISLQCAVYTRQDNGLWKQDGDYSFMTRYAEFGEVSVDKDSIKVDFIDKQLGLTLPAYAPFTGGRKTYTYRAQHEDGRNGSVLTPLTSEVSVNNLSNVMTLIETHKAATGRTDNYGRSALWYARTPEMQKMLTATTHQERVEALIVGTAEDGAYVQHFLESGEGPAFQEHMAPFGWEGMDAAARRVCIERFRMLPPALQRELLEEPAGKEAGLSQLLVEVLAKLDLEWGAHVMLFPEDASCIAVQGGYDRIFKRTLDVYTRQADGGWRHTTTFTMQTAHATLSDYSLQQDGADITVADKDFGIAFTEHFRYGEKNPVRGYRTSRKAQGLNTALNDEVKQGNIRNVHRMLESGRVNPNDPDINGDTSLDCACSFRMVEFLKAHGATKRRGN